MASRPVGRPAKITGANVELLKQLALAHPHLSLRKLTTLFVETTQIDVSYTTVRVVLAREGIRRRKPGKSASARKGIAEAPAVVSANAEQSSVGVETQSPAKRYGYDDNHRSERGERRRYPSSLTDAEWDLVKDLFINTGPGQPPEYERRAIVEACSYIVRSGCSWRMLPKEFPKWQNVYAHFQRWKKKGTFEKMHERLRGMWREREGRNQEPSAAIMDSQSVKTGPQGGEKGYDAGKKVKGRKRHLVVDFLGLLLAVAVLPASIQDRDAALGVFHQAQRQHPSIQALIVDAGYAGRCVEQLKEQCQIDVEVVRRPSRVEVCVDGKIVVQAPPKGFIPLPKRWIVERTNAWNLGFRRLVVDHERHPETTEAWIWFAQSTMLMRRLASYPHT